MDSAPTTTTPVEYLGLKTELQNIAGIIEQYPDHLKQRAFELLITAYLGSNHSKEITLPHEQVAQTMESAPAEAGAEIADDAVVGYSGNTDEQDSVVSASDLESQINANIESSTNLLRRRIRLRTMTPMRWQQSV